MVSIEIMWDDLTPQKQQEIQQLLGINDNGNWDIIPIATIEVEDKNEN